MTTATARKTSASAPGSANTKRSPGSSSANKKAKLRVVDKAALRRRRRRRALVGLVAMVVTTSLFAVALLYGQLVEGQQDIDQLRAEIAQAEADRARLERAVAVASTPAAIVARAHQMGLVRAENPQYLVAVRPVGSGE